MENEQAIQILRLMGGVCEVGGLELLSTPQKLLQMNEKRLESLENQLTQSEVDVSLAARHHQHVRLIVQWKLSRHHWWIHRH
jgi:hypothetical protein